MSIPTKFYLAGPMSGIPQANFPAFAEAAAYLRSLGAEIVSPAEMDSPEIVAETMADATGTVHAEQWGEFLARDVKLVADEVDGIVCLPGFADSRGARLECFVALLCNKPVFMFNCYEWSGMTRIPTSQVQAACAGVPLLEEKST